MQPASGHPLPEPEPRRSKGGSSRGSHAAAFGTPTGRLAVPRHQPPKQHLPTLSQHADKQPGHKMRLRNRAVRARQPTMSKHKALQDPISLVLPPSLYLGPRPAAPSKPFLMENSITHVLNIGAYPSTKVDGITYHRLSLSDDVSSSISKITDAACEVIDAAIASDNGTGKILVHCSAGISRSPTVVAAYLMKRKGMTLKAALRQIIQVRPQISPNAGFMQQLKEMEMELYGSCSLEVDELPKGEKDRLALFEEPEAQAERGVEGCSGLN